LGKNKWIIDIAMKMNKKKISLMGIKLLIQRCTMLSYRKRCITIFMITII
jgi:hypothetical protein